MKSSKRDVILGRFQLSPCPQNNGNRHLGDRIGAGATGRGLYGLRRALVLAGAQAQRVSIWKVGRCPDADADGGLLSALALGRGRYEALAMIANPATRHPY